MNIISEHDGKFHANLHFDCDCQNLEAPCANLINMASNIPKVIQDKIFDCKSVSVYNKWYCKFQQFLKEKNKPENFESVLDFFNELSKTYAPSTLWQAYSCINKYYTTYKNWKPFKRTPILKDFLKKMEKDAKAKRQSSVLSKEDIFQYLKEAPNDLHVIVKKAVIVFGYFGGLKVAELVALTFEDIIITDSVIQVFVQESKTDPNGKNNFHYIIPKYEEIDISPYRI